MRRSLNCIFQRIGRIIPSGCFGSFSTTAMRGTGRSYCEIGCHRETLTASNPFAMLAPRSRYVPTEAGIKLINEFTYLCAERYYKLIHDALRAADPGALIFSDRLPIYYSQDAVRAMAPYVDVIASNYDLDGPDGWVAHYFFEGLAALTGKPVLVSEFFCAAMENRSGNKNAGHLLKVPTQNQRAMVVQQALQNFARCPNIIGTHWFQYYDEPQGGRADGEDYNMGLVDIYDQPYEEVGHIISAC